MTTGQKVQRFREHLGISQAQLAHLARLSPQTIADTEHDRHEPTLITRRLLSAAFTLLSGRLVSPDELLPDPPGSTTDGPQARAS